ncbi:vexin isoform X1 [Rhineura floridana]|uniref:vexin isoform X1 n=1 Tax=Rhineura floridana TaxID=261503 RepID=UPI002AC890D4|nr:vexin isoform X1 [Rhineura floridana]
MHQIYSCSDENLEVFTVISTKSRSPVRRKAKSTQCILPKKVIAVSDYRLQGTEELLWHQGDLIQTFCKDEDGQGFSHVQNRQQRLFSSLTKCPATHTGISKQKSFCYSSNQSDAKTLQTQASPVSRHNVKWLGATEPAMRDGVVAKEHGRPLQKNTEDDISPTQGTKASLPLTGGTSHSTLSLLQKIWIKHKKKSEYLGATNSAFEAD